MSHRRAADVGHGNELRVSLTPIRPSSKSSVKSDPGPSAISAVAAAVFVVLTLSLGLTTAAWGLATLISASTAAILLSVYSFRFAWVCFVASMTMSGLSYQILGQSLLPEHIFLAVMAYHAVRLRRISSRANSDGPNLRLVLSALMILTWLLILIAFSAFNAPSPDHSLRLITWVLINVLAVFIIRSITPNPPSLVADGLKTSTAVMIIYIVGWVAANFSSSVNVFVEADYASATYRLKGLMLEPNLLAGISLLWLCVGYIYQSQIRKEVFWVASAVLSFGIFMTYTRAAWVILLLLLARLVWTTTSKNRGLILCILLATIPMLVLLLTSDSSQSTGSIFDTVQARFDSLLDFQSGTGAYRSRTWEIAWEDIQRDGWWTGHGYNSFSQTHFSSETSNGTLYLGLLWLSLIYDGGLFAFFSFVAAFILLWMTARQGSWWFFVAFIILSTSTNPTWYMFPWALAALVILPKHPSSSGDTEAVASRTVRHRGLRTTPS